MLPECRKSNVFCTTNDSDCFLLLPPTFVHTHLYFLLHTLENILITLCLEDKNSIHYLLLSLEVELFKLCRPVLVLFFMYLFVFFRMMLKACTARSRLTGREETENDSSRWSCTMWPPDFTTFAGQSTGQTVTCSFSPLQTTKATAPSSRSTNMSDAFTPLEIYLLYWWVCKLAACWCVSVIQQLQDFQF